MTVIPGISSCKERQMPDGRKEQTEGTAGNGRILENPGADEGNLLGALEERLKQEELEEQADKGVQGSDKRQIAALAVLHMNQM